MNPPDHRPIRVLCPRCDHKNEPKALPSKCRACGWVIAVRTTPKSEK